jgi:hypothetical protein
MKTTLMLLASAAVAVSVCGAALAARPTDALAPPEQARSLAEEPPVRGSAPPVRVSAEEARSVTSSPEFRVQVAREVRSESLAAESCWEHSPWTQWGTWPYQQRVTDHTYWCAVYGRYITYRAQHVLLGTSLCSHSSPYGFRISGGVNHSWVETQAGGSFSCPTTIPWFTLHYDRWFRVARNAWGNWAYTGNS